MTQRNWAVRAACALLIVFACVTAALPRTREPNGIYAERRAKLRAQLDGPVVLFGYTGREDASPSYVFAQEENFYYLTGHNEVGAAVLLIPNPPEGKSYDGPREVLFLQARDLNRERWDGPRLGPTDDGIAQKSGFEAVLPFAKLAEELEKASRVFPNFYTLLPGQNEAGYPHRTNWLAKLKEMLPQASFRPAAGPIAALRQVKSASELELLGRAIELSIDAHVEAMKMMRPGLWEYEVAARMEYIHKRGGCEREAYAPIVGTGLNSTVLHYNALSAQIRDGDVVVLDVAGEYSGYAADITRTLPANGKFTPRQREIYEVVLGAQNAVLAALKPGAVMAGPGPTTLTSIAREYINTHGKDRNGQPLGRYFIHGLGHGIGLNVHDPGPGTRPLEPGMVFTIEPGVYIPEENLGVRIEDIVLITADGYKLLTARLPRTVEDVEKTMAEGRRQRAAGVSSEEIAPDLKPQLHAPKFVTKNGRLRPMSEYRILVAEDDPEKLLILDGGEALLVDLTKATAQAVKTRLDAQIKKFTAAAREAEPLPGCRVLATRIPNTPKFGDGMTWLGWQIHLVLGDEVRVYSWLKFSETADDGAQVTRNIPPPRRN